MNIDSIKKNKTLFGLSVMTFVVYFFSNPKPQNVYDYTFRVAANMLRGQIGVRENPPSWLNEFVAVDGSWYSVFPLGSVLTMIPAAFFKAVGLIEAMPGGLLAALIAAAICLLLFRISESYAINNAKRILLVAGLMFGSWMWTNLVFAGAWQLSLGFAVLGELGAIYFTYFKCRPLLGGFFFALAFGNRTEIIIAAPIFIWLMLVTNEGKFEGVPENSPDEFRRIAAFCAVPLALGILTLLYNYVRFQSFTDFGYARIPGVLEEHYYRYGIFSFWYIPQNFLEMLYTPWRSISSFPYLVPTGFGGSIWWCSPFLFYLLRFGGKRKLLKRTAWLTIFALTLLLWVHGNPGGWQFGYRYAMILLPWMFVILLENSPREITKIEWLAYIFSISINAYATYLFFWTSYVQP